MDQDRVRCACGDYAYRKCRSCGKPRCNGCMSSRYQCFSCISAKRRKVAQDLLDRTRKERSRIWGLMDKWRDHYHDVTWDQEYREKAEQALEQLDIAIKCFTKVLEDGNDESATTQQLD